MHATRIGSSIRKANCNAFVFKSQMGSIAWVVSLTRIDRHEFEIGAAPSLFAHGVLIVPVSSHRFFTSLGLVLIRLIAGSSSALLVRQELRHILTMVPLADDDHFVVVASGFRSPACPLLGDLDTWYTSVSEA